MLTICFAFPTCCVALIHDDTLRVFAVFHIFPLLIIYYRPSHDVRLAAHSVINDASPQDDQLIRFMTSGWHTISKWLSRQPRLNTVT